MNEWDLAASAAADGLASGDSAPVDGRSGPKRVPPADAHETDARPGDRAHPWLVAGGLVAATLAVDVMDPAHRHVPLCPFHSVTGLWCPFCGGLRATQALAHADLTTALRDNVVFVASIPLLVWLWLDWLARMRSGRPARSWPRGAGVVIAVVLVAFAVVRNLPGAEALRP